MTRSRARARGGFTLIELMLATVMLAVGLLALVGALMRALEQTSAARLRHSALRQVEGVADSVTRAVGSTAGSRRHGPVRIDWFPESCAAGSCLRLIATIPAQPRDTVVLLVHASDGVESP